MGVRFNDLPLSLTASNDDMVAVLKHGTDQVALVKLSNLPGGGGGGGGGTVDEYFNPDSGNPVTNELLFYALFGDEYDDNVEDFNSPAAHAYAPGDIVLFNDGGVECCTRQINIGDSITKSYLSNPLNVRSCASYRIKASFATPGLVNPCSHFKLDSWYIPEDADIIVLLDDPEGVTAEYGQVKALIDDDRSLLIEFENPIDSSSPFLAIGMSIVVLLMPVAAAVPLIVNESTT